MLQATGLIRFFSINRIMDTGMKMSPSKEVEKRDLCYVFQFPSLCLSNLPRAWEIRFIRKIDCHRQQETQTAELGANGKLDGEETDLFARQKWPDGDMYTNIHVVEMLRVNKNMMMVSGWTKLGRSNINKRIWSTGERSERRLLFNFVQYALTVSHYSLFSSRGNAAAAKRLFRFFFGFDRPADYIKATGNGNMYYG